jgi:hypothetical protein
MRRRRRKREITERRRTREGRRELGKRGRRIRERR